MQFPGSVFRALRHFAAYGVRSASVRQPTGPVQRTEVENKRRFPFALNRDHSGQRLETK